LRPRRMVKIDNLELLSKHACGCGTTAEAGEFAREARVAVAGNGLSHCGLLERAEWARGDQLPHSERIVPRPRRLLLGPLCGRHLRLHPDGGPVRHRLRV